jgi:AcrR family transcriptional regulator
MSTQQTPLPDNPDEPSGRAQAGRRRRAQTRAKIIAAAFEIFGDETGLFARIEDVADRAGVTRATFYNHFNGMVELREALSHEVTHGFLVAVTNAITLLPDPRERSAVAIRYYLHRAMTDRRWAWSLINLSASGLIFGVDTHFQAERTVREGIDDGAFPIISIDLGRDILLGTCLAALGTIVRKGVAQDYPEAIAGYILHALGVPYDEAKRIAHLPLPDLAPSPAAAGN